MGPRNCGASALIVAPEHLVPPPEVELPMSDGHRSRNDLPYVVTGCARSGTRYISRLLSDLGLACGHERLFTPWTRSVPPFGKLRGDSSWVAAPYLDALPSDVVVLHQIRHPMAVTRSLHRIGFFSEKPKVARTRRLQNAIGRVAAAAPSPIISEAVRSRLGSSYCLRRDYVEFALRHAPSISDSKGDLGKCLTYWVAWNRLIEEKGRERGSQRYFRYRLEELDADLVASILRLLGSEPNQLRISEALYSVPRDTNAKRNSQVQMAPLSLTDQDAEALQAAAKLYGYEMPSTPSLSP
jgi:hypothetical protein